MAQVKIDILGDASSFDGAISSALGGVNKFGAGLKDAGMSATKFVTGPILAGAAGLAAFGKSLISTADELFNLSEKAGLGTTALQEFKHVGDITGVGIDAITNASGRFAKVITDSERGLSTATDALDALGISVYDNTGALRSQDELMRQAVVALQNMEDETRKMGLAQEVFGRGGKEMLPILNLTAEQFDALATEAHTLGAVMGEDMVRALDSMDDELTRVEKAVKGAGLTIGSALMPMMTDLIDVLVTDFVPWVQSAAVEVAAWITWFQQLSPEVKTFTGIAVGLAAAVGPLAVALGAVLAVVSGPLIIGIAAAAGVIAGITAAIVYWDNITAALYATWVTVRGLFTDNPWLAALSPLLGGIIMLVENWDTVTAALGQTWEWVSEAIGKVFDWLTEKIGGFLEWIGVEFDAAGEGMKDTWSNAYADAMAETETETQDTMGPSGTVPTEINAGVMAAVASVHTLPPAVNSDMEKIETKVEEAMNAVKKKIDWAFKEQPAAALDHLVEATVKPKMLEIETVNLTSLQQVDRDTELITEAQKLHWEGLTSNIKGKFDAVFSATEGGVGGLVSSLFGEDGSLTAMLGPYGPLVSSAIEMGPKIIDMFKNVGAIAKSIFGGVKDFFGSLFGGGGDSDQLLAQKPLMARREELQKEMAALAAKMNDGTATAEDRARYEELRLQVEELGRKIDEAGGHVSAATGFEGVLSGDTMFMAHRGERVSITPASSHPDNRPGEIGGGGRVVYVTVNNYGPVGTEDVGRQIRDSATRKGFGRS